MPERLFDEREGDAFVGRGLALGALGGAEPPPVVFVHGPGGIGKSALLREFGRRARESGLAVASLDGRDPDVVEERLREALDSVDAGGVLLFDSFDQVAALGPVVREALAPHLDAGLRAVVAGRRAPGPDWLADGWSASVRALRLGPLDQAEALELVRRRGLGSDDAAAVVGWAQGSPLALVVSADALLAGWALEPDESDIDAVLSAALLERLVDDRSNGEDREVIAVAAIARAVDARLLAAVLPGLDGDRAEGWLRELPFAESLGTRVTLHQRIREGIHRRLLAEDPAHERDLRRRLADHLHARVTFGEWRLSTDLAELIEDDLARWGLAPPPATHRAVVASPADAEPVAERFGIGGQAWWRGARRWFEQAPGNVVIVHDTTGQPVGYTIWAAASQVPAWCEEDPVLGPWLADARRRFPLESVLFVREARDLEGVGDARSPVVNMGSHAVLMRNQLASIRYIYAGLLAEDHSGHEFVRSVGYVPRDELDVEDGERTVRCFQNDMGAAGTVGVVRDLVYRDLGLPPPDAESPAELAADVVRAALRSFHDPVALASSPLARGGTTSGRAESVRRVLRVATEEAFGDSEEERLQREVLELSYLAPAGSAITAQQSLHLGRTAYFRRLADASERVGQYVLTNSL